MCRLDLVDFTVTTHNSYNHHYKSPKPPLKMREKMINIKKEITNQFSS
jgi:hypothetical protein